jgi:hypothetical protein
MWPASVVVCDRLMGTLGFFHGRRQLGYYANRELSVKKPAWLNRSGEPTYACVRLRLADAERALKRAGVVPARLGFAGWVEISLNSRDSLEESVRCFGIAYDKPPRTARRLSNHKLRK